MPEKSEARPVVVGIAPPAPKKQLAVHEMLLVFRKTILHEALLEALGEVDPSVVAAELAACAPAAGRQLLAAAGVRDELVFATPEVLRHSPRLLGYYRLLLGSPQKQFYTSATGLSAFKRMEDRGALTSAIESGLRDLCIALNASLGELIDQIAPTITMQDIDQLRLLVLGVQIDGALRNRIGADATLGVFESVTSIVTDRVDLITHEPNLISFLNNSNRLVIIKLAADPDMVIEEEIASSSAFKVAIEIKGGTDASNAHNRAGEAEKSHRKVSTQARDFWTIISLHGIEESALRTESPTTREWFDVSEVVARTGAGWVKFTSALCIACGI